MRKYLLATAAVAVLMTGSAKAATVGFSLTSVGVTAHGSGNGLIINTAPGADIPQTFSLTEGGGGATFNVLRMWTPETSVQLFEDTIERAFSMSLNFTAPLPGFSVNVGGDTSGSIVLGGTFGLQSAGIGYLDFDPNYYTVNFTSNAGFGTLGIRLEDAVFNRGDFAFFGSDLNPGPYSGAHVAATFKLVDYTAVPEPASLAVLGMGLLGLGLAARRRLGKVGVAA